MCQSHQNEIEALRDGLTYSNKGVEELLLHEYTFQDYGLKLDKALCTCSTLFILGFEPEITEHVGTEKKK